MSHVIMLIYLMTQHTREGTICMHILITGCCMCLLIILIDGVFFDEILHYSKNIVKLRMNMELHGTTVFFTIYRYIIKMLRSQVGDFIFWPFFFLNLICTESQVKDLSTKLFRRVGKKALVLPIGFWKFFSDTNRTTDRLKSKTNQGSHNTKINWMLL